ncbi:peptide ABC transporter permease [Nitrosopumilus sp. b1]|uniref:ABC transporter permease n=1 Tax=Nitrosopumilus sp. b1 TaxID=2109907 RepID=UPI0015F4A541|nr:ABC transporter permease [Nitrosopumilus sp. b1]KAF6242861.1 peptide ABC transporter permease [Nitrosopumilus sp. b1]
MSNVTTNEIRHELLHSKLGIAGIGILAILVLISVMAIITIPLDTFKEWNNPSSWLTYPKTSVPAWVNNFQSEKIPEHRILQETASENQIAGDLYVYTEQFKFNYSFDDFPNDFIYEFTADYVGSPLIDIIVVRPDGLSLDLISTSLPNSESSVIHNERIFSTDEAVKKNLLLQSHKFNFESAKLSAEDIVFSNQMNHEILKGDYVFVVKMFSANSESKIQSSSLIIGGKAFGIMGTDELRRDLAIGLLWGTPLALFIGIVVAIGSVIMGLLYGIYAGYKGKFVDESMMRFNDIIYALPALPFLIILAVTISNSIFLMIGFLMIFGWVGVAKVSRSMALQIKTKGYVEAAKMMGQKNSKIILKHILPQLLPYAFASIAISVPAAITTEAGLSFLGLGDPSFPTWGQILHDANTFGAAARGLWWWIMPPGIMIAITGLAFVFIGNALDAIVNPKLKKQ